MEKNNNSANGKRATMKQIAEDLGLTVAAVSKALKRKSDISETTCNRVIEYAEKMGYIPNQMASGLRQGRSATVAILYDCFLNPFFPVVTYFLERRLSQYGYTAMIFTDPEDPAYMTINMAKKLISRGVDGVFSFLQIKDSVKELFDAQQIPVIVVGRDNIENDVDSVCFDDKKVGFLATKAILDTGRKKIVLLNSKDNMSSSVNRFLGYKEALQEVGVSFDPSFVLNATSTMYNGDSYVRCLMESKKEFDGIFCFNDQLAFETIRALGKYSIRVPEEVMVVGCDNIAVDFGLPYSMPTVDLQKNELAFAAVDIFLKKLKDPAYHLKKVIDVSLLPGFSYI